MKENIFKSALLAIIVLSISFSATAQVWEVPSDKKEITPAITFSMKTKTQGKDIYAKSCKSCHGDIGKANFLPLNPAPNDPGSERFSNQTDGELFFKLTEGRGGMPAFKSQLADNERWAVISYIRSFHADYKPTGGGGEIVEESSAFTGTNIKLFVNKDQVNLEITIEVQGNVDGKTVSAPGVRVGFFIERNFGLLSVCEPVTTNKNGVAKAKFPGDLPGDSLGNHNIIIKLIDDDLYGNVEYKETLSWGKAFIYENPIEGNHLWGNNTSVPLLLLISYISVVLFVLITIGWVVLQMLKLKKAGIKK